MDKAGVSENPSQVEASSIEDIPEALREDAEPAPQPPTKRVWVLRSFAGLGAIAFIALIAGIWVTFAMQRPSNQATTTQSTPEPSQTPAPTATPTDTLLGHFAYQEAPPEELQPITADGRIKLRRAAAQKFQAMVAAARSQGVILVPISGFRPISEQEYLFFDIKAQRGQMATERATVSAPPGYSEHHTGYAVDIGDGRVPATNLSQSFENTAAFRWLNANAARYSFELSFPKNNPQGVIYEPWHWRFVGDRHSLETFYKARQSSPPASAVPPK